MALSDVVARVVAFLRAGYPHGVPATDYVPLIALLRRRLSDDEVVAVASELAAGGVLPKDATDIRVAITKITDEMPSPMRSSGSSSDCAAAATAGSADQAALAVVGVAQDSFRAMQDGVADTGFAHAAGARFGPTGAG